MNLGGGGKELSDGIQIVVIINFFNNVINLQVHYLLTISLCVNYAASTPLLLRRREA